MSIVLSALDVPTFNILRYLVNLVVFGFIVDYVISESKSRHRAYLLRKKGRFRVERNVPIRLRGISRESGVLVGVLGVFVLSCELALEFAVDSETIPSAREVIIKDAQVKIKPRDIFEDISGRHSDESLIHLIAASRWCT